MSGKIERPVLVASDGKPLDSPVPRCGNCFFWHLDLREASGRGFCYGEPPKLMMTQPPKPGPTPGSVAYVIEKFRPMMDKHEPPCSYWKPRDYDLTRGVAPSANVR